MVTMKVTEFVVVGFIVQATDVCRPRCVLGDVV